MNTANIIGNLTRDPELKHSQSGKAIVNFSIAVQRKFKKDETDFFECVAWDKTAELIAEHFCKGHKIGITGDLQQQRWEKDGKKQSKVIINVSQIDFLQAKDKGLTGTDVTDDSDGFPY